MMGLTIALIVIIVSSATVGLIIGVAATQVALDKKSVKKNSTDIEHPPVRKG